MSTVNQHDSNMKTTDENKIKTQLDQANELLKELAINVTSEDKKEAEKKYSRFTIATYLKGEAKDLDIAVDLIGIFKKRIQERDKLLKKAV
jgi:hypothetical protein